MPCHILSDLYNEECFAPVVRNPFFVKSPLTQIFRTYAIAAWLYSSMTMTEFGNPRGVQCVSRGGIKRRDSIVILPPDDPKKIRLSWVIREEIGIIVVNDYATAKVAVTIGS